MAVFTSAQLAPSMNRIRQTLESTLYSSPPPRPRSPVSSRDDEPAAQRGACSKCATADAAPPRGPSTANPHNVNKEVKGTTKARVGIV